MNELCGCCSSAGHELRVEADNRPELSAVAFRLGTFGTFRRSLLHAIATTPALAELRSRLSDDYSITLLELWAVVADVLTFYQERIANEGFLRTAQLRDSVLRMARLLGYQLRPGAAATTRLALMLDPGASLVVPAGLRVQSVPAAGEQPQKFETLEALRADARFSRLRIVGPPVSRNPLEAGSTEAFLAVDDAAPLLAATLQPSDRIVLWRDDAVEEVTLQQIDLAEDRVRIRFLHPIQGSNWEPTSMASLLTQTVRLFGHGAPATFMEPITTTTGTPPTVTVTVTGWKQSTTDPYLTDSQHLPLDGRHEVAVGARVLAVVRSSTAVAVTESRVVATRQVTDTIGPLRDTVTELTIEPSASFPSGVVRVKRSEITVYMVAETGIAFWHYAYSPRLVTEDCYVPGRRAGWDRIEIGRRIEKKRHTRGVEVTVAEVGAGRTALLLDDRGEPVGAVIRGAELVGSSLTVAATSTDAAMLIELGLGPSALQRVTGLVSRQLPLSPTFTNPRRELQVTIGGFPPQTLALGTIPPWHLPDQRPRTAGALQNALRAAVPTAPTFKESRVLTIGGCLVVVPGVPEDAVSFAPSAADTTTIVELGLDPAGARFIDGVRSGPIGPLLTTRQGTLRISEGLAAPYEITVELQSGWQASDVADELTSALARAGVLGDRGFEMRVTDDEQRRLMILPRIPPDDAHYLRLNLAPEMPIDLDAAASSLLGNVITASHGESIGTEIVGDAEAARAFQRFALRKKPLTYVPAAVPGGLASSLSLRVNGVQWREVATFYGAGPHNEVFVTQLANDGTTTVQFGDGTTGARPPTGVANIVAAYRQGLGVAGRVRANTLTTLLDRPTGLKAATNPIAADGGADPESLDQARRTAPGTVRTFGRAVSLQDFQDVTLASGEVAMAAATWVWAHAARVIHLTVAAQRGGVFSPEGLRRIRATLQVERDPNHKLLIDNYHPVPILVAVALQVDDRYSTAVVVAAAREALLASLSFDALEFAQSIHLSDIYRVLQEIPGVVAVDVDELDFKSRDTAFRDAHGATADHPQPRLRILPARPAPVPPFQVLPAELASVEVPSVDIVVRASGGLRI